ncbi:ETX/MTX2 family pore-forming toxin [Vagococcus coleopterorum]|uniref:ETX/MTX2 family pore-forming toxin n=1 Tax=Vagococcus coleopterorum TaxID=2714946 RepID=A0A6G8AKW5_9ENTE|nr:ETX/MTX2 family pore-forming toxin [Vagococcus coleopterorum]QIL45711.1 ETX/MTX2 family pore-forming toxin [Vagococcus coleopterorum]
MNKKITLTGLALLSLSLCLPISSIASTTELGDLQSESMGETRNNINPRAEGILTDPIDFTRIMLNNYGKQLIPSEYKYKGSKAERPNPTIDNFRVLPDGNPVVENQSTLFVGESILTNNTDTPQSLKTNTFAKTITHTISSQVTHGFKLGSDVKASFGIPLIGSTDVTLKTEYSLNSTKTNTDTETYTYTADAQSITVPPKSSVVVNVSLNEAEISGKTKIIGEVDPNDEMVKGNAFYETLGIMLKKKPINASWKNVYKYNVDNDFKIDGYFYDTESQTHNILGSGVYSANYGTTFNVKVSSLEKNVNSVDKTYTISPRVTKNN